MKCIYSLLLTTSGATTVLQSIIFLLWIVAIASQLVWMSLSSTAWCQYIAHWDAVILAVSYHLLFKSIWWLFTSLRVKAKVFTTPTRSSMMWLLLSSFLYLLWLILWFILLLSHWPPIVSCIWWTHCCFRPCDRCPLYLNCSLSLYTHTHTHTHIHDHSDDSMDYPLASFKFLNYYSIGYNFPGCPILNHSVSYHPKCLIPLPLLFFNMTGPIKIRRTVTLPSFPSWFQLHQSFNIDVAIDNWYNFTHTEALNDPSISGLLGLVSGSVARAQSLENATTGAKFREEWNCLHSKPATPFSMVLETLWVELVSVKSLFQWREIDLN